MLVHPSSLFSLVQDCESATSIATRRFDVVACLIYLQQQVIPGAQGSLDSLAPQRRFTGSASREWERSQAPAPALTLHTMLQVQYVSMRRSGVYMFIMGARGLCWPCAC